MHHEVGAGVHHQVHGVHAGVHHEVRGVHSVMHHEVRGVCTTRCVGCAPRGGCRCAP